MTRFLLGALGMGAVFVLSSFAFRNTTPCEGAPSIVRATNAVSLAALTLDRAFRVEVPLVGGGSNYGTTTCQVPSTGGFVITQIETQYSLDISINGVRVVQPFPLPIGPNPTFVDFNPPIVARPNDVITIVSICYPCNPQVVFAGYTTLPGET